MRLRDFLALRGVTALSEASARQASSGPDLIKHVRLERVLDGHDGCVNTVSFTPDGGGLLSGSDDLQIVLWDWQSGRQVLKWSPGHTNNIFQARVLPHTNNTTVVSCAADGQVRLTTIRDGAVASCKRLGRHAGRAHKLSLVPDQPQCFVSSGEDGRVCLYDLRAGQAQRRGSESGTTATGHVTFGDACVASFCVMEPQRSHGPMEVNAVHHNPSRPWLLAVGGADCLARVYDTRVALAQASGPSARRGLEPEPVAQLHPQHILPQQHHRYHITCVQFSRAGHLLATYNDEDAYLFSASGAGGQQGPGPGAAMPGGSGDSCGTDKDDHALRDRKRKASSDAVTLHDDQNRSSAGGGPSAMPTLPDPAGASASGSPPAPRAAPDHVLQRYSGHRNRQTVKGISFYGARDEYVVSGSDCGHVFIWDRDSGQLLRCMHGDRHVVNCLEPHPWQPLVLATSGIEDTIKVWSPTAADEGGVEAQERVAHIVRSNTEARARGANRVIRLAERELEAMLRVFRARAEAIVADHSSGGDGAAAEEVARLTMALRNQVTRELAADGGNDAARSLLQVLMVEDSEDGGLEGADEGGTDDSSVPEWARGDTSDEEDHASDSGPDVEDDDDDRGEDQGNAEALGNGAEANTSSLPDIS